MIRQMMDVINRQLGSFGDRHGPHYKIHFCIKERKKDDKRQRLDSLAELTGSSVIKRQRTMSQAVKDLSSDSIDSFVQQILKEELRVLEELPKVEISDDKEMFDGLK